MTKAIKTLIKLHKNKLDKILKNIELHELEKTRLQNKKSQIEEEISQEIEKFSTTEYSFMLEKYVENSRTILKRLDAQMVQTESIIARLRLDLKDEYSELKKYEIALANKNAVEQERLKKIEAKQLDEFSINNFISQGRSGK